MSLRTVPSVPYNGLSSTFLSGGGSFAIPSGSGGAMTLTGWSGLTAGQILYPLDATTLTSSANFVYSEASGPRLRVGSGSATSAGWTFGYASSSGYAGLWNTGQTPSSTNGIIIANSGDTYLQAAAGLYLRVNEVQKMFFGSTAGQGPQITAGTATTDVNAFSVTQTWNAAGVAFNAAKIVITDTASAAGALAENILGGSAGTTVLRQTTKGGHQHAGGAAPSITAGGGTDPSIAGTDEAFTVTVGSGGLATSVEVTFATAFAVAPRCSANHQGAILILRCVSTTLKVTIDAATPFTALGKIDVISRSGTT